MKRPILLNLETMGYIFVLLVFWAPTILSDPSAQMSCVRCLKFFGKLWTSYASEVSSVRRNERKERADELLEKIKGIETNVKIKTSCIHKANDVDVETLSSQEVFDVLMDLHVATVPEKHVLNIRRSAESDKLIKKRRTE